MTVAAERSAAVEEDGKPKPNFSNGMHGNQMLTVSEEIFLRVFPIAGTITFS